MKMDAITDETRLLCRNHIDTAEQLLSYKGSLESEMQELTVCHPFPIIVQYLRLRSKLMRYPISDNWRSKSFSVNDFEIASSGEVTPEIAHEVGVKLAEKMWGERFQVIVATHLNTECLHRPPAARRLPRNKVAPAHVQTEVPPPLGFVVEHRRVHEVQGVRLCRKLVDAGVIHLPMETKFAC